MRAAPASIAGVRPRSAAFRAGFRGVDANCTAIQLSTVELINGALGGIGIRHIDKRESSGTARFAIGYQLDSLDCTVLFEQTPDLIFIGPEGKIADKKADQLGLHLPI